MSGGRTRTTQQSTGSQQATSVGTGTPFASDILGAAQNNNVIGQVFAQNDGGFSGDRVATMPINDNMFNSWSAAPTNLVPQHSTGAAPVMSTAQDININDQAGIDAGRNNANAQAGTLGDISTAGLGAVQSQINSPNQGLDAMLAALRGQHAITSGQSTQDLAGVAGMSGAFGGTSFARDNAMQSGELQRAFDDQAAQLLWQDQLRRDQWLRDAPGLAGQYAGVGDLTAQRLLNYGGLDLQNQQHSADINQGNQDAANFNAWTAGTLNDTNADRAAQDAIGQWELANTVGDQNAAVATTRAGMEQGNAQAGLDNQYYNWASQQESFNEMLNRLQTLMGISAAAPGGSSSGSSQQNTTTTQQTQTPAWQTALGLASAFGQFATGNPLGGLGSLTSAARGPTQSQFAVPQVPSLPQLPSWYPSERRLKTNIEPLFKDKRDINWYTFTYKDDPSNTVHTGVMVDEIERFFPTVVESRNGVKGVDYAKLAEMV